MKIVFFGSDEFAATNLEKLVQEGHQIVGVVTPPDRARNRMKVTYLPVKMVALELQCPLFQLEDLGEQKFQEELKKLDADLFVVIAFGKFLPKEILGMPKIFSINVHASLLPQYRGAAPINWAIINGDQRTGVTIIKMNEQMDAGEMIAQRDCHIGENIDAQTLRENLADLGAQCLIDTMKLIETDNYVLIPQDEQAVTFASKLTKKLGCIDWSKSTVDIHNLVRGLVPRPSAYTVFQGKRLKILETEVFSQETCCAAPGSVLQLLAQGIVVGCGQGQILLKRVQLESSKPMDARSFSLGQRVAKADIFNNEK